MFVSDKQARRFNKRLLTDRIRDGAGEHALLGCAAAESGSAVLPYVPTMHVNHSLELVKSHSSVVDFTPICSAVHAKRIRRFIVPSHQRLHGMSYSGIHP